MAMAYAAVISLKQTIHRLINSPKFSLHPSAREILGFAYKAATSLHQVLERVDHGSGEGHRLDCLEAQIKESVHKLEDFLELHQSDLFAEASPPPPTLLLDSEQLRQQISTFAEKSSKLTEDYAAELDSLSPDREENVVQNTEFGVEMVGFSDELNNTKLHVQSAVRPDDWGVLVIVGPAGSGRSYAVRTVFDDVDVEPYFDLTVWVTVGSNGQCTKILELILTQILIAQNGVAAAGDGRAIMEKGEEEVAYRLLGWRYMIVLDDVRDTRVLDYLYPVLPVQNNGSVVVVTTAEMGIAEYTKRCYSVYRMEDVYVKYEDIYWDVLRRVFFQMGPISPEMEEAGRKIVRSCRGLRICMSKVIMFLWSDPTSPEVWNRLANDPHHPLYHVADELQEMRKLKEDFTNLTVESDKAFLYPFVKDNGFSVDIEFIKNKLFPERFFPKMEIISFVGMAGIGKTTFVKNIFEYLQSLSYLDRYVCAWVTLGPKYQPENILFDILAQIHIEGDNEIELGRMLSQKRFLIVLDDVWNIEPLHYLAQSFPNIKGRAFVTTRLVSIANSEQIEIVREMRFLSKEESWDLLRKKVFGEGVCPHEFKKAGKKIAENCDGLPLTVIKVANLLLRNLSPQYWNDVANKNLDFTNSLKELSEELVSCYESLPQYLKPCFLYMGIFPQEYEVSAAEVLDLWIDEGFLEPEGGQSLEEFAGRCLLELVNRSLVMVCRKGSDSHGVEACRLNSVLWHLSNNEAVKNKFFLGLNNYAHDSFKSKRNERRFSIRNCILLMIKEINHDLMMDSISTAHSLLCTGTYHKYPVPVCFELRLLRVLDTRAIRFYEFPDEVVKLIHLRHLAITCAGEIPASISRLWNLRFFLVSRHLRIRDPSSYLPLEIWDMKELRHLQVVGSNLPNPSCGTILPNLVTLLDVSSHSCNEEVLQGIPNLKKLGIQIEFVPEFDDTMPFHYLNNISNNLSRLESLECVVVNPDILALPPPPISMFPSNLDKLSLSGIEYPWEYMSIIGGLRNLKVLELRCYAFRGDEWETGDHAFKTLKHLVIEDTDLVRWKTTITSFSKLRHLSIRHCYNLEQLPYRFFSNEVIEVVECNPYAVNWAKQMQERNGFHPLPMIQETVLKTHVQSSWDVGRH